MFGLTIFLGAISVIFGIFTMIYDLSHGAEIIKGFMYFSLGAILAVSMLILYSISALTEATKILGDLMFKQAKKDMMGNLFGGGSPQMGGGDHSGEHPLAQLFKKIAEDSKNGEFGTGKIKITKMDKDGNIHHLGEREFKSHDELVKFRDEVLSGEFGKDVDLKDMSINELKEEENKAVQSQKFELAASIRDLILEKMDKKNEK